MNPDLVSLTKIARNLEHLYRKIASNHAGEMALHHRVEGDTYTQEVEECLEEMGGEINTLMRAVRKMIKEDDGSGHVILFQKRMTK